MLKLPLLNYMIPSLCTDLLNQIIRFFAGTITTDTEYYRPRDNLIRDIIVSLARNQYSLIDVYR